MTNQSRKAEESPRPSQKVLATLKSAFGVLLGVVIGGVVTVATNFYLVKYQADADLDSVIRQERKASYVAYLDAANAYASAAEERFYRCKAGSDQPADPSTSCTPTQQVYQNKRYNYVTALHELQTIGSIAAIKQADQITAAMPNPYVGFTGLPQDAPRALTVSGLGSLFVEFRRVARCDVYPDSGSACE